MYTNMLKFQSGVPGQEQNDVWIDPYTVDALVFNGEEQFTQVYLHNGSIIAVKGTPQTFQHQCITAGLRIAENSDSARLSTAEDTWQMNELVGAGQLGEQQSQRRPQSREQQPA